jgi:hypothetical protein
MCNAGNRWFAQEKIRSGRAELSESPGERPKNADATILIGNTYANRGDCPRPECCSSNSTRSTTVVLYNGANYYNSAVRGALKYYRKATITRSSRPLYQLGLTSQPQNNAQAVAATITSRSTPIPARRAVRGT